MNKEIIEIPYWWTRPNGSMIARFSLPWDHPESDYSYIKNVLNLIPEDYGIYKDLTKFNEFNEKSKEELVKLCIEFSEQIENMEKWI